jgi:hypothetical protein
MLIIAIAFFAVTVFFHVRIQSGYSAAKQAEWTIVSDAGFSERRVSQNERALEATIGGVELLVQTGNFRRPGIVERRSDATIFRVAVDFQDQLICPADEVEQIFGPLPSVKRVLTGDTAFDAKYACFFGQRVDEDAASHEGGYRGGSAMPGTLWGSGDVQAGLIALKLQWARVESGQLTLAFAHLDARDIVTASRLAANIVRATRREPWIALDWDPKRRRFQTGSGAGGLATIQLIFALPAILTLSWTWPWQLDRSWLCDGSPVIVTEELEAIPLVTCLNANGPAHAAWLHIVSVVVFWSSLPIVALLIWGRLMGARPNPG